MSSTDLVSLLETLLRLQAEERPYRALHDALYRSLRVCYLYMPVTMESLLGEKNGELLSGLVSPAHMLLLLMRIGDPTTKTLREPWWSLFHRLGQTSGWQRIQQTNRLERFLKSDAP